MTIIPVPERTEELIAPALKSTVQRPPEVSKEGVTNYFSIGAFRGTFLPGFGTREREFALREWYRMDEQVLVRGGFTGLAKHIANLPWEITGDDAPNGVFTGMGQELGYNTDTGVEYFQAVLRHSNFGHGWGELLSQVVLDYLRYDSGAFIEVIGGGDSYSELTGAITGLAHLDPLRCVPTGDPRYPIIYYDRYGGIHVMHYTRVIQIQDMNDGDELRPGYGDSALARAISIAARQTWTVRYINAYLDDQPAPGIDLISGITKTMFETAEAQYKAQQAMDGKPTWGKRMRFYSADAAIKATIESHEFQASPEKFDFRVYTDIDVDTLALAMGVDRQELMQLMGGNIGSEAQSLILHQKSKGKTIGYLITELERRFNDLLPDGYTFGFKYRDEQEARSEAEKANLWGDFVQKVKEFLTPAQAQMLMASQVEAVHEAISTAPRVNDVDIAPESTPVVAGDDTAGAEQVGSETPEEMLSTDAKAVKSYEVTQSGYLQALRSLVKQAIEGEGVIGRYSFGIRARNLLRTYGLQAYKDGMAQGGVFVDELDPEDERDYQSVFVDQASYVGGFSDDIYVRKSVTMGNLDMRVNAWGKSLRSFVDQGVYSADKNGMFIWTRDPMKESCPDCKRLENQVHRFKTWKLSGWLPRSSKLKCWGAECGCNLVKTNEKARGRF